MKMKRSVNPEIQSKEGCLVSVIIPTKERLHLLRETLASLSQQTFMGWEALIVDDVPNDQTKKLLATLTAGDSRFRYLPRTHQPPGASSCRNIGISQACGDYVVFLDSDDLLAPECLCGRLEVMYQGNWDYAVFLTQVFHLKPGDDSRLWNEFNPGDDLERFLALDMPWSTTGPMWRREALERIGPWDESCESAQDWEFHIRALALRLHYTKISSVDSFWRESRPGSISDGWGETANLLNRSAMIGRVSGILRQQGMMTSSRRRRLAVTCHKNAFVLCPDNRVALQIWNDARRYRVVTGYEWLLLMVSEGLFRMVRKCHRRALALMYPESAFRSTHLKVLK